MGVFAGTERHRVAVLVRHGVMPMELGIAHQMFRQAAGPDGGALYEVLTCAPEPGEVRTDADFPIQVRHGPEAVAEADTLLVPASHAPDGTEVDGRLGPELRSVLAAVRPGTRIASICTGAFVLAAAGLLDGRRATTHWKSATRFRRLFPRVRLDPDVLFVDEGQVLTSAGEAAGIDLCLHMVRRDHGEAIANDVARATVVPPYREGGQAQYIPRPVPATAEPGSGTLRARTWAVERLGERVTLARLAEQEAMSVRTFCRRFRDETGTTPMRWLTLQRLHHARHLLERTDRTIEAVAAASGLGTAAGLRRHFAAELGVTPTAYRATFRGPPP